MPTSDPQAAVLIQDKENQHSSDMDDVRRGRDQRQQDDAGRGPLLPRLPRATELDDQPCPAPFSSAKRPMVAGPRRPRQAGLEDDDGYDADKENAQPGEIGRLGQPRPPGKAFTTTPPHQTVITMSRTPAVASTMYRLTGTILHRGSTPFSGHYVADVLCSVPATSGAGASHTKVKTGADYEHWVSFNDETVERTGLGSVIQEAARDGYVLFFQPV